MPRLRSIPQETLDVSQVRLTTSAVKPHSQIHFLVLTDTKGRDIEIKIDKSTYDRLATEISLARLPPSIFFSRRTQRKAKIANAVANIFHHPA